MGSLGLPSVTASPQRPLPMPHQSLLCQLLEFPLSPLLLPLKVRAAFKHKTKVWSLTSSSARTANTKPFSSDTVSKNQILESLPFAPLNLFQLPSSFPSPSSGPWLVCLLTGPAMLAINLVTRLLRRWTQPLHNRGCMLLQAMFKYSAPPTIPSSPGPWKGLAFHTVYYTLL